ncbi:MAG: DNA recombination protein RmuC [Pseudomonadota bacterium]
MTLIIILFLIIIIGIILLIPIINRESKEQLKEIHSLREEFKLSLADHREKSSEQLNTINEKNLTTFSDVIKRLALIDEAQKRINELSSNIMSLQSILNDKRSRGAFGEVQLSALVRNLLPEQSFSLQYTLSNGKRCDCILFLPQPSGNIVIDAKFPLETYRKLSLPENTSELSLKQLQQQFRQDLKIHIQDIAAKYLIPGETADGAMMFIPAEAIFSDIHAHYPDIVDFAHQKRVWLVSPTTVMAILTTARAVLKDAETRTQIHVIQEHLNVLGKDFNRFQNRMDNLVKHIEQAREDATDVNTSAKKITSRFSKI